MMRHSWIILAAGLSLVAGCSGYDKELLGDPEPTRSADLREGEGETTEFEGYQEGIVSPADSLDMYGELRFYGSWYTLYPYGWVWRPIVTHDWMPMVDGHWAWTSYGWMWIPYEPFGAITYTYGFWVEDFALGWVWVPNSTWAVTHCEWIVYDDYICWAPLPPPNVRYKDPWNSDDPWISVPVSKFKDTEVAKHRVKPRYKPGVSDRTMRRQAPDPAMIERGLGREIKITPVEVRGGEGTGYLARVVLPPDEEALIAEKRAKRVAYKPAPPSGGSDSGNGGSGSGDNGNSKGADRPSKEKPSSPPAKGDDPPKFKEKAKDPPSSDSKSKPTGDSKDKGKG